MNTETLKILDVLRSLPVDKVKEVEDFALYLKDRYGRDVDISDEWTDEDMRDAAIASFKYFEASEKEEVQP